MKATVKGGGVRRPTDVRGGRQHRRPMRRQQREAQQPDGDAAEKWSAPAAHKPCHGSRNADAAARFARFTRSSLSGDDPARGPALAIPDGILTEVLGRGGTELSPAG
ncbi:MAG: hypothetical protein E6H93_10805 [Chloroflexi bacterium]|nr:MAG: hypothetical protein E6H93_10805 [Chloroflexota bacterium]